MQLDLLLSSRQSVRKFKPEIIAESDIRSMIRCALQSPSPSNSQPVRFINIESALAREQLRQEMAAGLYRLENKAGRIAKPKKLKNVIHYYWRYSQFMLNAPLLLAVGTLGHEKNLAARFEQAGVPIEDSGPGSGLTWAGADITTGFALAAFILKGEILGIKSCILTAPLMFIRDTSFLAPDRDLRLTCFVAAGYPDEQPDKPPRLRVDEVYFHV